MQPGGIILVQEPREAGAVALRREATIQNLEAHEDAREQFLGGHGGEIPRRAEGVQGGRRRGVGEVQANPAHEGVVPAGIGAVDQDPAYFDVVCSLGCFSFLLGVGGEGRRERVDVVWPFQFYG